MNQHDLELARWSEDHHGVFSVADALRIGLTEDQCAYRIRSGRWVSVHESAYRILGSQLSPMGRLAAVSRVIRSDAGVSHRSAAYVFDLPGARADLVEVTSPRRLRVQRTGIVTHESRKLRDVDLTVVKGIRVTTVPRTILDLGAVCSSTVVEMAIDRALRRGLTSLAALQRLLFEVGKRGRPGVASLREAVDARDPREAPTESEMETRLRRVLRAHGLPRPVPQHVIRDGDGRFVARVDFAYPQHRIAIEYDSVEHHVGTGAHIRDSARRLQIEALRWSVLVATVEDVRNGGDLLAAAVRARIDADSPRWSA